MRKFNVVVNGENFDVSVDEMGGAPVSAPAAAPAAAPASAPAAAPSAPVSAPAGAHDVAAPMPGTILKVLVGVGDSVKAGDALVILEAMKMQNENDIVAPADGKVAALFVKEGDSVESNSKIAAIE